MKCFLQEPILTYFLLKITFALLSLKLLTNGKRKDKIDYKESFKFCEVSLWT